MTAAVIFVQTPDDWSEIASRVEFQILCDVGDRHHQVPWDLGRKPFYSFDRRRYDRLSPALPHFLLQLNNPNPKFRLSHILLLVSRSFGPLYLSGLPRNSFYLTVWIVMSIWPSVKANSTRAGRSDIRGLFSPGLKRPPYTVTLSLSTKTVTVRPVAWSPFAFSCAIVASPKKERRENRCRYRC